MFYLLEDNSILDSKNLRKDLSFDIDVFIEDNEAIFVGGFNKLTLNVVKIKNQSENVCDLIEVGDLVAQKKIFGYEEIYNVSLVWGKDDKLIKCFYCTMFEDKVVTIYKPNSKGDYIKVWEKKMEV